MTHNVTKTPSWFWILASVILIWNLMGIVNFFHHVTVTEEQLQTMTHDEQILLSNSPWWSQVAFALAVFGGSLGSIALIARRRLAAPLFITSLFGIVVQMGHSASLAKNLEAGGNWIAGMTVLLIVIATVSLWLVRHGYRHGWMR